MSRRQALLDDGETQNDDYVAYSVGADSSDSSSSSKKKKYVIAGIALIIAAAIAGGIGWYISSRDADHHHDTPSDIPAVALSYFLVSNVRPSHYSLHLNADPDTGNFDGVVSIDAAIQNQPVSAFYLHSLYLDIQSVDLAIGKDAINRTDFEWALNGQIESTATSVNAQQNLWIKSLTEPFNVTDQFSIVISFRGIMPNTSSNGFYRVSYKTDAGDVWWVGTTQFEPTHARRAFPCFDEPAMKATFDFQITAPSKFTAVLSNGAIASTNKNAVTTTTVFEQTPIMSSYLTAWVITNFKFVKNEVGTSYPFRGWGRPDKYLDLQYMTNQASQFQQEFHDLMGVTYLIPKLDQVAMPGKGGAMENWGCVIYSEPRLYVDNDTTSAVLEQAYNTNSHELAHFLFGDYVTPMWWSNNWLKEGSATFWSYVTIQQVMINQGFGDWNTDALAVIGYQEGALVTDSDMNAPPLHDHRVETAYQVANHFGGITYNKGGSFLRMIRALMGQTAFYKGCKDFLAKYARSNAWGVDFFNVLNADNTNAAIANLTAFLLPWAEQPGFPLVSLNVVPSSDPGINNWEVTQQRYNAPSSDNTRWPIWLQYYVIGSNGVATTSSVVMNPSDASVTINAPVGSLIKMNFNRTGFYRVRYDANTFDSLATLIEANNELVSTNDRISLVHDVWQLQHDGLINNWDVVFNVTAKVLRNELEYTPIASGLQRTNDVWMRIRHAATADDANTWKEFQQQFVGTWARELYWGPGNSTLHLVGLLQGRLGPIACRCHNVECREMAKDAIYEWAFNGTIPHSNIRATAFELSPIEDDGFIMGALLACYRNTTTSNSLARYCLDGYLAHLETERDIQQIVIDVVNGTTPLRPEDSVALVIERLLLKNDYARAPLINLFSKDHPMIWTNIHADQNQLAMIVFTLVASAQTNDQLSEVTGWLGGNLPSSDRVQRSYADAQQQAQRNIAWVQNNWPQIKNWIGTYYSPVPSSM